MSAGKSSSNSKPRLRREQIEELLAQRAREGLTWKHLSEHSGVPVSTLTSWQQKLRKEAGARPGFVELAAVSPSTEPTPLILATPSGLRIEVPSAFDADALSRLLAVIHPC